MLSRDGGNRRKLELIPLQKVAVHLSKLNQKNKGLADEQLFGHVTQLRNETLPQGMVIDPYFVNDAVKIVRETWAIQFTDVQWVGVYRERNGSRLSIYQCSIDVKPCIGPIISKCEEIPLPGLHDGCGYNSGPGYSVVSVKSS